MGTGSLPHNLNTYLGRGSYGIVFKSRNKDNTSSAIKLVFPSENEQEKQQIFRECTLLKGKSHPNVVQIEDAGSQKFSVAEFEDLILKPAPEDVQDGLEYLIKRAKRTETTIDMVRIKMELCGQTLREWLNSHDSQKLTVNLQYFQVEIISQLMAGICFLHDNKIIHRDLKPENVMFSTYTGAAFFLPVKVGDFSLCRILHGEESKTKSLTSKMGTYAYRAPETESSNYDYRSDIYPLGLITCEVLHLLRPSDKGKFLVNVKQGDLQEIEEHPLIENTTGFISVAVTQRMEDRIESIRELEKLFRAKRKSGSPPVTYFDVQISAPYQGDVWVRNVFDLSVPDTTTQQKRRKLRKRRNVNSKASENTTCRKLRKTSTQGRHKHLPTPNPMDASDTNESDGGSGPPSVRNNSNRSSSEKIVTEDEEDESSEDDSDTKSTTDNDSDLERQFKENPIKVNPMWEFEKKDLEGSIKAVKRGKPIEQVSKKFGPSIRLIRQHLAEYQIKENSEMNAEQVKST